MTERKPQTFSKEMRDVFIDGSRELVKELSPKVMATIWWTRFLITHPIRTIKEYLMIDNNPSVLK